MVCEFASLHKGSKRRVGPSTRGEPGEEASVIAGMCARGLAKGATSTRLGSATATKRGIGFRGKNIGISEVEKNAYHKDVDIYWSPKAWVDRATSRKWVSNTWAKHVEEDNKRLKVEEVERLMFADSLDAQTYPPNRRQLWLEHNERCRGRVECLAFNVR